MRAYASVAISVTLLLALALLSKSAGAAAAPTSPVVEAAMRASRVRSAGNPVDELCSAVAARTWAEAAALVGHPQGKVAADRRVQQAMRRLEKRNPRTKPSKAKSRFPRRVQV